jgi:hypothetical protein
MSPYFFIEFTNLVQGLFINVMHFNLLQHIRLCYNSVEEKVMNIQ